MDDQNENESRGSYVGPLALTGAVVTISVWGIEEFLEKTIPGEVAAAATTIVYAGIAKLFF